MRPFHSLGEKERAHIPRHAGGDSFGKEEPEVAALARAGAFQPHWQRQPLAGFTQCASILLPAIAKVAKRLQWGDPFMRELLEKGKVLYEARDA